MKESDHFEDNFKQIEDIIDARKEQGYYNIYKNENSRFSMPNAQGNPDRYVRFDDSIYQSESSSNLKLTDSEVTIVRVRCGGTAFKRCQSKWDMQDIAIPGDGSHLGESPSLVNLATMVIQFPINLSSEGSEYLVPLSSWDPYYKFEEISRKPEDNDSESINGSLEKTLRNSESLNSRDTSNHSNRHIGIAEKITRFIRKRCKKTKSS
ncbi:hypothetical protein HHI36_005723 [Cryptolaemus montrouzieri]|uniref:Uncharacterized protein n=1 Tax=Cryptolaemus montrouzieri TaxID=559131 RepID=A0ABD2NV11_9CUCU